MKLRSQLLIGISAVMVVALIGLGIGVFSVLQMAREQRQSTHYHYSLLTITQEMRKAIGSQMTLNFGTPQELANVATLRQDFARQLQQANALVRTRYDRQLVNTIAQAHDDYLQEYYSLLRADPEQIFARQTLNTAYLNVRNPIIELQEHAITSLAETEQDNRERAVLIASLLGLVGCGVLLIGFLTAHGFARRFSGVIERLAQAADQIGQGDFNLDLPHSPTAELSALISRFSLMGEALRQSKESNVEALLGGQLRLQALLDSIDDGLLVIDRQGLLEHANPVAQRQLAWSPSLLGRAPGDVLKAPMLDEAVQRVLDNQPVEGLQEDLAIQAEGELRLLSWRLSAVSHADGRTIGAVLVLRDVTEQRAFERVRNEFVLRASHELRTPLTGIHMAFGLLHERLHVAPDSRESELLRTINEEMRRMLQLINDLLNFSRYQSGQQQPQLALSDPGELLENAYQRFASQADERNITLQLDLHPPLPWLQLDRLQIDRVLDNLIDNALRHTPSGEHIRLQARQHGKQLIISIEDSGEGIPYSQQERIFEPFVQIGHRQGSVGLGLALCKEIVRMHGGRLGVHSRPGQGAVFFLVLPLS
ncbi:ATP-binding protein [Pseudomonas sp. B392_1p]|jgi:NtrC-family two-component system sensor histidine kinase KinB|uniref:ATP-binding protein n=1 Tax=Pseudomonas sp. B392_1p TaxID=3457507 RepID=UPI003FD243F5